MKFSVVIPTRNRLEYLKYAVHTVLNQDYNNWEVIVSDNDSEDDIKGYILSLNEPRIKYSRTEKLISVTENWNRALNQSTGDYVICIGDDDCLMQGAFSLLEKLIKEHAIPELIFSNGLQYTYPGIFPNLPNGYLTTIGNWDLWGSEKPIMVDTKKLRYISTESMNFRLHFSYNMQLLTLHRSLIEKLKVDRDFFHSPYPDFYAMTVLFQKADNVLACPYPITIVGLSPKSYGGLFFNNKEELGLQNLSVEKEINEYSELEQYILPGNRLNTCWLFALRSAQKNFSFINDPKLNFSRYRRLQLVEFLKKNPNKTELFTGFFSKLYFWEKLVYGPYLWSIWFAEKLLGENFSKRIIRKIHRQSSIHQNHINYRFEEEYSSILDVFRNVKPLDCKAHFIKD